MDEKQHELKEAKQFDLEGILSMQFQSIIYFNLWLLGDDPCKHGYI